MKLLSHLALLPAFLALASPALPAPAADKAAVPPLYDYKPERVYTVTYEIPLPKGEQWQKLASTAWFKSRQPLRMEFSLIGIDFRTPELPKFTSPGLLLGGKGKSNGEEADDEGWMGISRNFSIGFDPGQTTAKIKDGIERRATRMHAGGARTSSGVIGIRSLTREGEYDWYLPMQTNEISVLQYAAVMAPGEAPPSMNPEILLKPRTDVSRRDAEDFTARLNSLRLIEPTEGKKDIHWNIRRASEKEAKPVSIALGRNFYFALPTQTEWEYAARGGELTGEHHGKDYPLAECPDMQTAIKYEHCRGTGREGGQTLVTTVFIEKRNCLGLFNMLGNAMEWVDDDRLPHGAGYQGDPTLCSPVGSVSPASRGEDIGNTTGADNVGFRLVIRSSIYSTFMGKPYGINPEEETKAEAALASAPKKPAAPAKSAGSDKPQSPRKPEQVAAQVDTSPVPPVTMPSEQMGRHRVKKGDTWDTIARHHGMDVKTLKLLNPYATRLNHLFPETYVDVPLKEQAANNASNAGIAEKPSAGITGEVQAKPVPSGPSREELLEEAMKYIRDNYGDDCTENDYARSRTDQECKKALAQLQAAENKENASARCLLGYCNEKGIGMSKNRYNAFRFYELAAQKNLPEAQYRLGLCYEKGIGTAARSTSSRNTSAFENYLAAAEQGHAEAQYRLGLCYENGLGTSKAPVRANQQYEKAAAQGNADAHLRLGDIYEHNKGAGKDLNKAIRHYTQAAAGFRHNPNTRDKFADTCFSLGRCCSESAKKQSDKRKRLALEDQAFNAYHDAAQMNHREALYRKGACYEMGRGVSKNMREAVSLYLQAANMGFAQAQLRVAYCYANGTPRKDLDQAAHWYEKAASQDRYEPGKPSQLQGAAHDGMGWVCKQRGDRDAARKWYNEAIKRGSTEARKHLRELDKR